MLGHEMLRKGDMDGIGVGLNSWGEVVVVVVQ